MYGDTAQKLIQDAKRTQVIDHLPPYQEELVRSVVREIRDLDNDIQLVTTGEADRSQLTQNQEKYAQVFVRKLCISRNKRCLLAYQKLRAEKLDEMSWEGFEATEAENVENLNHNEQEYLRRYTELVVDYKGPFTDIDLSGPLEPPKDVFIDVRVLKDAGEIQTEYGYAFKYDFIIITDLITN